MAGWAYRLDKRISAMSAGSKAPGEWPSSALKMTTCLITRPFSGSRRRAENPCSFRATAPIGDSFFVQANWDHSRK